MDDLVALGVALGCVGIGLSLVLGAALVVITVVLYRKIRRLEKAVKRSKKREQDLEKTTAQLTHLSVNMPSDSNGVIEQHTPFTQPATLATGNDVGGRVTYENTEISADEHHVERPVGSGIPTTLDNYNDVVGPLPNFLRSEDMLMTPAHVPQDQLAKSLPLKVETPPINRRSTYMDPQDAKSPAASKRMNEKLNEMSRSVGKEPLEKPKSRPGVVDRVNYSEVLDALPRGVSIQKVGRDDVEVQMRSRTNSDAAVILGPPGPKDETYFKKTQSLRRDVSPNPPPIQFGRRRSSARQKEMVTFDPSTAAFKLEKKYSHSDGTSSKTSSSQSSPTGDRVQPVDMFLEAGGQHVYAAVDLSVKCRPDDDILRREGVGTPDHYVACIN